MINNFRNTFEFDPSKQHCDMPTNYKPELEITYLCNDDEKAQYWKCFGEMQCDAALGRIYIMYLAIVLSQSHLDLRKVYLANIQHLYVYLKKYTSMYIKYNTEMPTYDNFKTIEGNRVNLYAGEPEYLPRPSAPPMVNPVLIYIFLDQNLMDDPTTGRSQTGIIHILNNTPVEW